MLIALLLLTVAQNLFEPKTEQELHGRVYTNETSRIVPKF